MFIWMPPFSPHRPPELQAGGAPPGDGGVPGRGRRDAPGIQRRGLQRNERRHVLTGPGDGAVPVKRPVPGYHLPVQLGRRAGGHPGLTHDQLRRFHQRHYHPSNAFFYTYGDLPLDEHLAFIHDKILSHFTAIDPQTEVPSQKRWKDPRVVTYTYPLDPATTRQKIPGVRGLAVRRYQEHL